MESIGCNLLFGGSIKCESRTRIMSGMECVSALDCVYVKFELLQVKIKVMNGLDHLVSEMFHKYSNFSDYIKLILMYHSNNMKFECVKLIV